MPGLSEGCEEEPTRNEEVLTNLLTSIRKPNHSLALRLGYVQEPQALAKLAVAHLNSTFLNPLTPLGFLLTMSRLSIFRVEDTYTM